MSMNIVGQQANVTVSGGVTLTKHTANVISTYATGAASATLGTVPANKVWRIISLSLTDCMNAGAAAYGVAALKIDATTLMTISVASTAATPNTASQNVTSSYYDAVVATAGQVIAVSQSHASGVSSASIMYVEEDA